jgi:hypothetical protein
MISCIERQLDGLAADATVCADHEQAGVVVHADVYAD